MKWTIPVIINILLCTFLASAETISLNGTVKKTGGTTGIAGVKVHLARLSALSATTGADGAFSLSGSTSIIKAQNAPNEPVQFMIKGTTITFAPTSKGVCGSVAVFSIDGKMQSSIRLHDLSMGEQNITLPRLCPGINIMRVTVGPESFTRTLVRAGNNLVMNPYIKNANNSGGLILAKQLTAAAVDTLIAEKNGYFVNKVAIPKYTMDNIAISLDTNSGCTREALKSIADSYIAAQKDGDPSRMPLASTVTYKQNNKTITADKSICRTAMPIDFSLLFFDVDSCRAFVEIISSAGATPWVMMTWLKAENGKISGVDAMVTTTGDFQFSAKNYLTYAKVQDWSILTESQKITRQKLINGANAYLDMFRGPKVDTVPWGSPCERIEGGNMHITPDCISGMPGHGGTGTVDITNRRYAVDVDMGTVDVFCSFAGSMPDSHLFRLIDGKIRLVHTLSVQNK
jgi:hypothetical protein